jgi:hypothetical protein
MQDKHQEAMLDDSIGLVDIIRFFIAHRHWIAICAFLIVLGAALFLFTRPSVFEASATIQVAMVDAEEVETPAVLSEKIKLPLYFSKSTLQSCARDGKPNDSDTLAGVLKTRVIRNSPFLNISVQMASPEQAKACLLSVTADIQTQQALLATPLLQKLQAKLDAVKFKLKVAEEISNYLASQGSRIQIGDDKFAAAAMLLATSTANNHEIKTLRLELMELETALSAINTNHASLAAPIFSSPMPLGVQPWLVLLLACFAGVFLGVLTAWMKSIWPSLLAQLRPMR